MSTDVEPRLGEHVRRLRTKLHLAVENSIVSPSLGSLQKIAETLGVTLGDFFAATASTAEESLIVRQPGRHRLDSTWTDGHLETLGPMTRIRRLQPFHAIFGLGGQSGKRVHAHSREEFAFVVRGRVTLTLSDEGNELSAGIS